MCYFVQRVYVLVYKIKIIVISQYLVRGRVGGVLPHHRGLLVGVPPREGRTSALFGIDMDKLPAAGEF